MMQQEDCKRLDLHQTRPTAERVYLVEPDAGWRNDVQATISTAGTRMDATGMAHKPSSNLTVAPANSVAGAGKDGVVVTEVDPKSAAAEQFRRSLRLTRAATGVSDARRGKKRCRPGHE